MSTDVSLWNVVASVPPMPLPTPASQNEKGREKERPSTIFWLTDLALESVHLSSDARPSSSFVILGKLLTSLTLRFLACKTGIIITPVQQGDYENYLHELINTSNAIRTVPSIWYKAFNQYVFNWVLGTPQWVPEKLLHDSTVLDKILHFHKLSSSFIQVSGKNLIYDIRKLPKLTQTFKIISHLDYYSSLITGLPVTFASLSLFSM